MKVLVAIMEDGSKVILGPVETAGAYAEDIGEDIDHTEEAEFNTETGELKMDSDDGGGATMVEESPERNEEDQGNIGELLGQILGGKASRMHNTEDSIMDIVLMAMGLGRKIQHTLEKLDKEDK
jgi:hypothetical protein